MSAAPSSDNNNILSSLNIIIAQPAAAPPSIIISKASIKNKKKKTNNRYEKRRRRAARARREKQEAALRRQQQEAAQQQKQQQQRDNNLHRDDDDDDDDDAASAASSFSSSSEEEAQVGQRRQEEEDDNDDVEFSSAADDNNDDEEEDDDESNKASSCEGEKETPLKASTEYSTSFTTTTTTSAAPTTTAPTAAISSSSASAATAHHHLPDDALEERARYLAEYHARPLELDRRAGAHRAPPPSRPSHHLFVDGDDSEDDVDGDSDNTQQQQQQQKPNNSNTKNNTAASSPSPPSSPWHAHFAELLHPRLLQAVAQQFSRGPTRIQTRAVRAILLSGTSSSAAAAAAAAAPASNNTNAKHVMIHSETGSGKTLAYLLPLVQSCWWAAAQASSSSQSSSTETPPLLVDRAALGTRCLILCPTRELARQTATTAEMLCRSLSAQNIVVGCLLGDERRKSEKARIRRGLCIVVATPGRLLDHLQRTESLLLHLKPQPKQPQQQSNKQPHRQQQPQWLVLDEADRLLDLGLGATVQQIVDRLRANHVCGSSSNARSSSSSSNHQWRTVLCSATVTRQVQQLAEDTLLLKNNNDTAEWIRVDGESARDTEKATNETTTTSASDKKGGNDGGNAVQTGGGVDDAAAMNNHQDSLAHATPRQLVQLHVTVSAKLRLPALVAFLARHRHRRVVVFLSTCAAVDYYHRLFATVENICCGPAENSSTLNDQKQTFSSTISGGGGGGLLGPDCPIYKLHGSVPHGERQRVLRQFTATTTTTNTSKKEQSTLPSQNHNRGSVLLCTDVAARGLNLPHVDWIVQLDPPADVADYVHRAGRVARAGAGGHALLFLLPSERGLLDVLQRRGVRQLTALSLQSLLDAAAKVCPAVTEQGVARSGGGLGSNNHSSSSSGSRKGEAFCAAVQHRLEDCVVQDDLRAKQKQAEQKRLQQKVRGGNKKRKKDDDHNSHPVHGELLELARQAFLSYIRSYPTREKSIRHIFAAKALHLGHVARSFALKEPPKKLAASKHTSSNEKSQNYNDLDDDEGKARKQQKLAFDFGKDGDTTTKEGSGSSSTPPKKTRSRTSHGAVDATSSSLLLKNTTTTTSSSNPGKARALLLANAAKLQNHGLDSL